MSASKAIFMAKKKSITKMQISNTIKPYKQEHSNKTTERSHIILFLFI